MKNLFLIAFLYCSTNAAYAQTEVENKKSKSKEKKEIVAKTNYLELGINLTGAIASAGFHFADNFLSADPYFLHLKFITHKFGIRAGFGTSIYSKKKLDDIDNLGRIDAVYRTDFRVGLDYQTPIDEHWRLYYGVDVLKGFGNRQNDFLKDGVLAYNNYTDGTTGVGPILGIQYHLNKRISFQTEASVYFTYNTARQSVTYSNLPNLPPYRTSKSEWKMPIGVPHSLFVIVRF